jgi:hypothetical protein
MIERKEKELTKNDIINYRNKFKLNLRKEQINKKIYLKRNIIKNEKNDYFIDISKLNIDSIIKEKFSGFNFDKINESIEYLLYLLSSEKFDEKIYGLHILYISIEKEIHIQKKFNINNFLVINEKNLIGKLQILLKESDTFNDIKVNLILYEIYYIFLYFSDIIVNLSEDNNDMESVKQIENCLFSDDYIKIYITHLINKDLLLIH